MKSVQLKFHNHFCESVCIESLGAHPSNDIDELVGPAQDAAAHRRMLATLFRQDYFARDGNNATVGGGNLKSV